MSEHGKGEKVKASQFDMEVRGRWSLLVKKNDNYICRRCNKQLSRIARCGAVAHHIIPVAEGGKHTIDNGVALCISCNNHVHVKIKKGMLFLESMKRIGD